MGMVKKEDNIMKKTITLKTMGAITLLAVTAMAALSSCSKDGFRTGNGRTVRFSASSDGAVTKTSYGDDNSHAKGKVAIPWSEGDVILIASPQAERTNHAGEHSASYTVLPNESDPSFATVENYDTNGNKKRDTNDDPADENGLAWGDDTGADYTFFSIFPSTVKNENITLELTKDGNEKHKGLVTAVIPSGVQPASKSNTAKYVKVADGKAVQTTADDAQYTYTVYNPDMNNAFMTAATTAKNSTSSEVSLKFFPAFTAIEINLTNADDEEVSVKGISLSGTNIAGKFTTAAGTNFDNEGTDPLAQVTDGKGEVSISFGEKGETIDAAKGITATLFTVPVTNTTAYTLSVTTADGTAKVVLNEKLADGETVAKPYKFLAGKKYRINLLKLGNRLSYSIALAENPIAWYDFEESTSFSDNVQSGPFKISGIVDAEVDNNNYEAYDTGTNNNFLTYDEYIKLTSEEKTAYVTNHPSYAYRYYNKRTLNLEPNDAHFEIVFNPKAPLAGYWNLVPEAAPSYGTTGQGGTEGFKIYLVKKDTEGIVEDPYTWSYGQIMGADVKLHIYPDPNRDTSKEYCMIIKTFFSANRSGDPSYSADSETQDPHGDGTISYWKFVIPATD